MKEILKIEIPIEPRSKKNSQQIVNIKGRYMIIPSKLYRQYEKDCEQYLPKLETPIDYPVNVKCLFYLPTRRRADLTNFMECIDDVLVSYGILLDDNYTIVAGHDGSRMCYFKDYPHTEVYIEKLDENV